MDHLLPPLGVGSGRERETLWASGTGCCASPFQCSKGQNVTFHFVSTKNFLLNPHFCVL